MLFIAPTFLLHFNNLEVALEVARFINATALVGTAITIPAIMNILLWINKSRCDIRGEASIMLRVTHNGKRTNVTTGLKVAPKQWDSSRQKIKGNTDIAVKTNSLLQTQKAQCLDAINLLLAEGKPFSSQDILEAIQGGSKKEIGFLELFDLHIKQLEARIGVDYAKATVVKYRSSRKNLVLFLKQKLKVKDIEVSKVDRKTVAQLDQFLRGELKFSNNYVNKVMEQIRKAYKLGIVYEYVQHNPFDMITFKKTETAKEFLSKDELNRLLSFNSDSKRMNETRDVFLFLCFTGLSHADARKASIHDLKIGSDNNTWLELRRTKTNNLIQVPVLPFVKELITKYTSHPKCVKHNKLMPVPCNQVLNRAIKLLMKEVGIEKHISSHSGRYTFASTVLLSNGIRVEVAQRLLAHNSP